MNLHLSILIKILIAALFLSSPHAISSECGRRLKAESYNPTDSSFEAGVHRVIHYPIELQLERFGFSDLANVPGTTIAVFGDGFSGLGLGLKRSGKDITLIDLAYDPRIDIRALNRAGAHQVQEYRRHMAGQMLAVSAADTGLAANTFDMVLSHLLINNVSLEDGQKILTEALRVLKPGGEAIFVTQVYSDSLFVQAEELMQWERLIPWLRALERSGVVANFEANPVDVHQVIEEGHFGTRMIIALEFSKP